MHESGIKCDKLARRNSSGEDTKVGDGLSAAITVVIKIQSCAGSGKTLYGGACPKLCFTTVAGYVVARHCLAE